jgi:hypothetical protein
MWYGVDGENHVLVMELLGKTVEGLFLYCQQRVRLRLHELCRRPLRPRCTSCVARCRSRGRLEGVI